MYELYYSISISTTCCGARCSKGSGHDGCRRKEFHRSDREYRVGLSQQQSDTGIRNPNLISQVHAALLRVSSGRTEAPLEPAKPAVSVKKSITPDYLVCLEDGKRFKSLKRHLRTQYNMTPEQYREKWGLPADYPMVAPNYAVARSQLAKKMGLGQQRKRRK